MLSTLFLALKSFFRKSSETTDTSPPTFAVEPEPPTPRPLPSYPSIANLDPQTAIYSVEIEVIFTRDSYGKMRNKDCVSTAFVEVHQCLSEGVILPYGGSDTKWDIYDLPTSRTEYYGTKQHGLFMRAEPKTSGHGTHGESGYWQFTGLPPQVKISGEHHVDYRMPSSRLKLLAEGIYECQGYWLIQNFALALREAIGGEWFFHEGTWSQTAPQNPITSDSM